MHKLYDGIKLLDLNPIEIAREVGTLGFVVIRNSGTNPAELAEWSLGFGYHLSPEIWCTDKEFSNIFWRVTPAKIDEENQGLSGDHELDWHSNITPVLDGEELVGLYGRTLSYHTETWFCNTLPYWNQLDEATKERYRRLTVVLDPNRRLGRVNGGWSLPIGEIYSKTVIDGFVKNRRTREISKATNMEEENRAKYKCSRGVFENARFVPRHPLGTEGLFFSPFEIHGFYENGEKCPDSEEIYWKVYNEMVLSEKYTYKHVWQEGDLILMDQLITIHRRPTILKDKPRELLRIACWYKSQLRNHFDYVL